MNQATFERELPSQMPALHALARRLMGNQDEAQDVVQEALLRASRNLSAFREDSSLKTWLFSITSRVALDALRSAKRWNTQSMVDACDARGRDSVATEFANPSIGFDVRQHISFCLTCVGRSIDPLLHAALVLREFFQLENAEAAGILHITEPVYRHALADARTEMREKYEGLCALVNKNGACYQCAALREMAPEQRKGPPLPTTPLSMQQRVEHAAIASTDSENESRLNQYFFSYIRQMQK